MSSRAAQTMFRRCLRNLGLVLACSGSLASAQSQAPIFDVHTHYKWDQAEITTPQQALDFMDAAGVQRALVIGTPADLALQLKALAPERIVAFYGPYLLGGEKLSWQFRKALVDEARAGLQSGQFQGIGELHLIGSMAVRWDRSLVFRELLKLGLEFDVPLMVHTEYASIKPTVSMCQANPENRFLLAHAGAVLPPEQVARILDACPNVMMDLAARDPWRYVSNPIADESDRLLPAWRELLLNYPSRFMIGSDTVWPVDRASSWDEPNSGWQELGRFIGFHRRWLADLPEPVARALRHANAERYFGNGVTEAGR